MPQILDFRKPDLNILDECVSWTGKYYCFFGVHYNKGKTCWDVGISVGPTGEIRRRHYTEDNNFAPEASAKTYWERLKEGMVAAPSTPEEMSLLEEIEQWQAINDPKKLN